MTTLRDFLNWYDGFAENVEEAPTPKQWERVKAKLAELRGNTQQSEPSFSVSAPASEPPGGAHTTKWWKEQVFEHLTNNDVESLDEETARIELASIPVDLNAEPMEVALRVVRSLMN